MKTFFLLGAVFLFIVSSINAKQFVGSFDLIATQTNSSGKTRADTIEYYFAQGKTAIVIHGRRKNPNMRMIFNFEDSTITSLFVMNGRNGGFILPMDELHWPGLPDSKYKESLKTNDSSFATGKTNKVEGYICSQLEVENSDYKATMYVTDKIQLTMFQVLSYQSVGKGKSRKELDLFEEFGVSSLPLILELESKTNKPAVSIELINFGSGVDESIFSTEGYTLSKME